MTDVYKACSKRRFDNILNDLELGKTRPAEEWTEVEVAGMISRIRHLVASTAPLPPDTAVVLLKADDVCKLADTVEKSGPNYDPGWVKDALLTLVAPAEEDSQ